MSHPIPTMYSHLSNKEVDLLFSTQSWNNPAMDAKAKAEACQELENRLAEQDNVPARNVFAENMNGTVQGQQGGSCIFVNSNILQDGVTRTTTQDEHGNQHTVAMNVSAPNLQMYDTICHEHSHGLDLDKGTSQTVSYVDPEKDYDLYRIQADERKAYDIAEEKTKAALATIAQELGKVDENQQAYLDVIGRDSYKEALARAIEHYQDKDIQATLDKVCADFEKGNKTSYQSQSAQRIADLLQTQLLEAQQQAQQAQSNAQTNASTPNQSSSDKTGEKTMSNNTTTQEATQEQGQTVSGWEADLAELDNDAQQGGDLQEAEDQGQDNDDGMEM